MYSHPMENILNLWPTLTQLSQDIAVPYPTVAAWKRRGSIPAKFDLDLIDAAQRRGHVLTLDDIAQARRARGGAA